MTIAFFHARTHAHLEFSRGAPKLASKGRAAAVFIRFATFSVSVAGLLCSLLLQTCDLDFRGCPSAVTQPACKQAASRIRESTEREKLEI